jgi:hypothetical protein
MENEIFELSNTEKRINEYIFSNYQLLNSYEEIENYKNEEIKKKCNICDILGKKENMKNEKNEKKNKIVNQFMINNNLYSKISNETNNYICDFCSNQMNISEDSDNFICQFCGKITTNYKNELKNTKFNDCSIIKASIYLRKNHFREWLNHLQGKSNDTSKISKSILDEINKEIKIMNIQKENITKQILRKILKKKKMTKYYDHEFQILYLLNGRKPIVIEKETEILLTEYFIMVELAFEEYKKNNFDKGRKNLLRYSYVIYKLCELLELDEYLDYFSLLKDRLKKLEQDKIWKFICGHNGWKFYTTV